MHTNNSTLFQNLAWQTLSEYSIAILPDNAQDDMFNSSSDNLDILIISHLKSSLKTTSFSFYQKKLHHWNRQISHTHSKRPPRMSVQQLLWYLLTPYLLHKLLQLRILQKTQKNFLIILNQQTGIYKCNPPLISQSHSPSIGEGTNNYLQELRSVQVLSDNTDYLIIWHLSSPVGAVLMQLHCILINLNRNSWEDFWAKFVVLSKKRTKNQGMTVALIPYCWHNTWEMSRKLQKSKQQTVVS